MINIPADVDDASTFVHHIGRLIEGMLKSVQPAQVFLVKVDQWFGPRWFQFSYKCMGAFGVHSREEMTLPPFHPNRIVRQRHFLKDSFEDGYSENGVGYRLDVRQTSESNASRYVSCGIFRSSAMVWYSGATRNLDRGCLMVYYNTPTTPGFVQSNGWYLSLNSATDRQSWKVCDRRGISQWETDQFHILGSDGTRPVHA